MAPERPLPVESLLPFDQTRSPETRAILQEAHAQLAYDQSQSPDSQDDDDGSGTEKPKRQKRSRACVACRQMKIRCLPVEGQEACSACAKVNRQCIMPGPPRKRQKTVHKVAELEKKINALTDALLAKQQQQQQPLQQPDSGKLDDESPPKDAPTNSSSEPARSDETPASSMDFHSRGFLEKALGPAIQPRFTTGCDAANDAGNAYEPVAKDEYVDVVDRGDLTMESAAMMFNHWREKMCPTKPFVVFPPSSDAQEIRKTRPMTFLAILVAASAALMPSAQPALTIEINRQISERVLFHGDKSLDLVQALLLNSQYYTRPRTARDLAFNHNIQAANVMALELGIGKRSKMKRNPEEEVELCRTWLACYQASVTVTTILRLPSLIRCTPRLEECLQVLSTSPLAVPSDKWLCALGRLSKIAEEVSAAFEMDDPGAELNFTSPRVQYQLKGFQKQLRQWEKDIDVSIDPRLIQHHAACLSLYIHEIAIHQDHNVDDFRPAAHQTRGPPEVDVVSAVHVEALSILLTSSHQVLDTYLSLNTDFVRTLSNLYIVWSAYAVVVLIKLHWLFNSPDSKFGATFLPDIKASHYLDAILDRLSEISADGKSPCATAFGFVFTKIKVWHLHRSSQFSDDNLQGDPDASPRKHDPDSTNALLRQTPVQIMTSVKKIPWEIPGLAQPVSTAGSSASATVASATAGGPPTRPFTPAFMPGGTWSNVDRFHPAIGNQLGHNLNVAYDVASYGNTNWDQFNFSTEELDMFDVYMNNSGWMGYLL